MGAADKPIIRSFPKNKKNHGKVPKKIHKAEREKLKRDHLNELFLELGVALDSARQNNCKASILGDATRLLLDLLARVECLKKEHAALLSESHYVTVEKNELRDEKSVLESEVKKLQREVQERIQSKPARNALPPQLHHDHSASSQLPGDHPELCIVDSAFQAPPVVGPVFVVSLHHDVQAYPEPEIAETTSKPPSHVSRPHARYPTPSDSWPSQILSNQPKTSRETQLSSSNG